MITITESTLDEIASDFAKFKAFFEAYVTYVAVQGARLTPVISPARLQDAHSFWTEDLDRLKTFSLSANDGAQIPDHFKQAAHLAFWIRRQGPVVEYHDAYNPQDSFSQPADQAEEKMRDLLFNFGSEYLAFDLGYLICRYYEIGRRSESEASETDFHLDTDYIKTVSYFLKAKSVSPHALYLIYKSLFYKRFD